MLKMGGSGQGQNGGQGIGTVGQYMAQGQQPSGFSSGVGGGMGGSPIPNSWNPGGMGGLSEILSIFNSPDPMMMQNFLAQIRSLTGGGGPMQHTGGPYRHVA